MNSDSDKMFKIRHSFFFVIVAFEISPDQADFYMIQFVLISQISFYCFEAKYASIC